MPTIHASSSDSRSPLIRPMEDGDLAQVLRIQQACYGEDFHEPREAFSSKLLASPDSCWVTCMGRFIYAYLVTLPIEQDKLPALHADHCQPVLMPTMLYLHDLAIDPGFRGGGLSQALLKTALAYAREQRLPRMGLVAVQGSEGFWRRQGFTLVETPSQAVLDKLSSFGDDAVYMARTLT